MKRIIVKSTKEKLENNQTVSIIHIKRILVYSAKNNKAKRPLSYSTLKPETSSDSPSAKSNGARFVSAKVLTNKIRSKGTIKIKTGNLFIFSYQHRELLIKAGNNNSITRLTS